MQERERPKIAPKPAIASKPKYVPPVRIQQRPASAQLLQSGSHSRTHSAGETVKHPQHVRKPSTGENKLLYDSGYSIPHPIKRPQVECTPSRVAESSVQSILRRGQNESTEPRKIITQNISTESSNLKNIERRHQKDSFLSQSSESEPLYPRKEQLLQQKEAFIQKRNALQEQLCPRRTAEEENVKPSTIRHHEGPVEHLASFVNEKYDKLYRKTFEVTRKPPNSPSTVCCSILSNAATECCGIINVNKKEMNGSSSKMTKLDSVDSTSSDSGGFKDFVQLPTDENQSVFHHQRKISQPEFLSDRKLSLGHQRKASHPEFESSVKPKTTYVANAQALAQFLPQTEQKILQHHKKNEEARTKQPKPILAQGNLQQSTKKLEQLLSQRLEKEKVLKKSGGNCLIDGKDEDVEQKMLIQRQLHQKLHADLEQTVKQIQVIQSIEYRLPQNRKWTESNRSQPAIGLKHTPKSR
ncbi:uncharacterized protein LOC115875619, partial [Sitophilus oryzae]|uniref:Uncharacterized protein LOC115875619 n=1 Tax=Sitophilus oryzae TaxID=7048 RepID=A0A6J2X713_SITOR